MTQRFCISSTSKVAIKFMNFRLACRHADFTKGGGLETPTPPFVSCFVPLLFCFLPAQISRLRNYCRTDIEVAALPLITNYNGLHCSYLCHILHFASFGFTFPPLLSWIFPIFMFAVCALYSYGNRRQLLPTVASTPRILSQSWSFSRLQWVLPLWDLVGNREYFLSSE